MKYSFLNFYLQQRLLSQSIYGLRRKEKKEKKEKVKKKQRKKNCQYFLNK